MFTESGHGKSACDGVVGNIKTQVEEVVLQKYGENDITEIHSVKDIKRIIEDKTRLTYDIVIHTAEEIKIIKDSLPKLGPLTGAMKIHEIVISSDGVCKKKNMPSDLNYQEFKIKESRKRIRENPESDEIDSEDD